MIQIGDALTKIFGTSNERTVKRMLPMVKAINALEPEMQQLSDEQLRAKTDEFRARIAARVADIQDAEERYQAEKDMLDEILPEAFAVVREAGRRGMNMRHFDVQLIGGMVLHSGQDRRDEDGRRQNAGRYAAVLSECARGPGRACRHGERLPGQARRRVDGQDLRVPGAVGRRDCA